MELYRLCQRWGALPKAGGIDEQDWKTMKVFQWMDDALTERKRLDDVAKGKGSSSGA